MRWMVLALLMSAGLMSAGLSIAPAASETADQSMAAPAGSLAYTVLRKGEAIGSQTFVFRREGDRLTVRTRADIAVDMLFVTVYRFHHESEEQWVDGRLVALTSRTDDNGKQRAVEFRRDGDQLRGTYNGEARDVSGALLPASLWHPDTVRRSALLDPVKGRSRRIAVTDKGADRIAVAGGTVTAHRYAITGQVEREVWYGADGRLLQYRFIAKDGSEITAILQPSPISGDVKATGPLSSRTQDLI